MKFKYTALGASNQKLEGVLDAESIDAAREELHKMGLSVVGISEVSAQEAAVAESQSKVQASTQGGIVTFYFIAKDTQAKEVNGTIDAKDANSAYRRLLTEYRFDVVDLYPQSSTNPAADSSKEKFEEWKHQMEDEGIDLTNKSAAEAKSEEEDGEKISQDIIAEMDQFIINTKMILKNHPDNYSEAFLKEIQNTLNELERIRSSNNLKHITKICNELYELVSNPDKLGKDVTEDSEYSSTVSKLKGSGFVANSFQFQQLHSLQKKLARFERTQQVFSKIKKVFNRKGADKIDQNMASRIKKRRARWLAKLSRGLKGKNGDEAPSIFRIFSKFFSFISAPNVILRRARKQDIAKAFTKWKEYRKQSKTKKLVDRIERQSTPADTTTDSIDTIPVERKDFVAFFMELDSFAGWLLFFYIAYFFMVSFAIEKNVGLSQELVLKTIASPLIINISIFLVIAHLAFTLKIKFFRSNFLGSLFLFFLCFGGYTLIVVNF